MDVAEPGVGTGAAGSGPSEGPGGRRTETTFAERLNLLFAAFLRPRDETGERREWNSAQFIRALEHVHGETVITAEGLRLLRTGRRPKTTTETAAAIARTFEWLSQSEPEPGRASAIAAFLCIDPAEANPEQAAQLQVIDHQLRTAIDLRDSGLGTIGIMARLGDLEDPQSLQQVHELVEQLQAKEKRQRGGGKLLRRR